MSRRRRLVGTRREVPAERRAEYDPLWAEVQAAATAMEAHAWRFVSAASPERFLEFLEFAATSDPRRAPPLADVLARLESAFAGEAEEWDEA
jgi:hypothetical protein